MPFLEYISASKGHLFTLMIRLYGLVACLLSQTSQASDMPKGPFTEPEASLEASSGNEAPGVPKGPISQDTAKGKGVKEEVLDCAEGLGGVKPQQMVFDPRSLYLYLLVDQPVKLQDGKSKQIETGVKSASSAGNPEKKKILPQQQTKEIPRVRKMITRLDINTGVYDPLVSFVQKSNAQLMLHPGGISALNFAGTQAECGSGKALMISINFSKNSQGAKAVHHSGTYRMVQSPQGWILADTAKKTMIEVDGAQFQRRAIRKLLADGFPIYYSPDEQLLVHWVTKTTQKGIIFERGLGGQKTKKVSVPDGEQLIVSPTGLGVVSVNKDQMVSINSLKGLNVASQAQEFQLILPAGVKLNQISFDVHFPEKRAIIIGKNTLSRKSLRQAWIYGPQDQNPEAVIDLKESLFVEAAMISPDGKKAAFDIRKSGSGQTEVIRVYDYESKKFADFPTKSFLQKTQNMSL